ncbi:MAG: dipeptidase [Anaerolineales bacterium]|jgi:acetylornithine deacetylase/succinyl-diaminopimelate desuccinylase-like protein|nr:dipeptidase [Anaerolineales bacterium]MCJ7659623.1 dipeptidase [Anaerolineales bacterium]
MTDLRSSALIYALENQTRFLEELCDFLKIQSISTYPDQQKEMQQAAEWVADKLRSCALTNVQIFPTEGHPVVYGESLSAQSNAQTVLIYGHYDVQPPDPLELWESGPFEPDKRGENLYARGATDMKGQVLASINAIEAIVRTGDLPINVKFLIEGEEEIGSPNLGKFIANNKDLLACDFALNPDTGLLGKDIPTITYALRGLAYFEIRVYGPDHDLHSGIFGGIVHNPAQALCELIAGMHDEQGRIMLPGYYDKVQQIDEEERAELARLPMDEEFYLKQTGSPAIWGEAGYSPVERTGARPTLDVNGIISGFTGEGSKTILPSWAMAKISMRLVPDQDPEEVYQQLQLYMENHAPNTIRYEIINMVGGPATISDRESSGVKALDKAMETVWGKRPVFKREGGSVPVVGMFQEILGVESVNCGFSLPDDNFHSPNEKLHLPTWYRGIDTFIHFFYNL